MKAKEFLTEAVFNIIFKAQLPDGKPYLKKFKITAPDKYTASDKIKEKLGNLYDKLLRPTFIFGDQEKKIAPDYVSDKLKGLKESEAPIKLSDSLVKPRAWIEKVYALYPQTWQNNHVMPMGGAGDDQQFAMFELIPSMSKKDSVEVKWFQAYPLRQGVGSRAMKELQDLARTDGIGLTLFPWQHGQVSQAKLTKFYKGQGFKPTLKGAKSMYWTAQ